MDLNKYHNTFVYGLFSGVQYRSILLDEVKFGQLEKSVNK